MGAPFRSATRVTTTPPVKDGGSHADRRELLLDEMVAVWHDLQHGGVSQAARALDGAHLLLNTGPAGVCLVPRDAWAGHSGLIAAADVNAVPPAGIEGIEATDDGVERDGVAVFGALAVGKLKMKVHKACIQKLFERNDQVQDAEAIAAVAGL